MKNEEIDAEKVLNDPLFILKSLSREVNKNNIEISHKFHNIEVYLKLILFITGLALMKDLIS
jgi:hypothetical protein